ncbi:MAG: cysteine--1-D-myo-inosityl 2-amino-2-deoxy-alpha-D-glucopyranoside ligase [Candidatus Nanopelagicales bacterium]
MYSWPTVNLPLLPGTPVPLRLFDTASGEVRPTAPGPQAKLYVCGITPYDATHIGHANTYVAFDLLNRQWRDNGHEVIYAQNITDVDDPLLERATATGVDWAELAESQTQLFRDDMTELRVLPPEAYVGVVESVDQVVVAISRLIDSGQAYQVDDDWYFDISLDSRFGSVSSYDLDTQLELFAERGGDPEREGKRHPLDCLLWLAERPGEPSWDAPFGKGRPGWHIECSVIADEYLGTPFDVQGGGSDLVFPHHEMSASLGSVLDETWPFARLYAHSGMVSYEDHKMSKSRGNLVFVSKLLEAGEDPMAIRLALLSNHYRSDWEWTDEVLAVARERLQRWRHAVSFVGGPDAIDTLAAVRAALADDLDAPKALKAVDAWCETQRLRSGEDENAPGTISRGVDALLGVAL